MSDLTYTPKTYRKQGGDEFVVAASGAIDFQTGAVFKDTTAGITAANRIEFISKKAWTGTASTAGGIGSWQAPTGSDILITEFLYDITAASATAGCVLDIGTTETSAVTKSDTLIDGLVATGSITGLKSMREHAGTNGVGAQKLAAGKWITGSATDSQADTLAGSIYVKYVVV